MNKSVSWTMGIDFSHYRRFQPKTFRFATEMFRHRRHVGIELCVRSAQHGPCANLTSIHCSGQVNCTIWTPPLHFVVGLGLESGLWLCHLAQMILGPSGKFWAADVFDFCFYFAIIQGQSSNYKVKYDFLTNKATNTCNRLPLFHVILTE